MDKKFLLKAIVNVYKDSIINNDDEMKSLSMDMLNHDILNEADKKNLKIQLKEVEDMYQYNYYTCYIDGAVDSQSDKTTAAASFIIYLNDEVYYKFKYQIPSKLTDGEITEKTSSHMAEYQSLIMLLRTLSQKILNPSRAEIKVYTDSEVLRGQYYADYRVTNKIQKDLRRKVFDLSKKFKDVELEWISRDQNVLANNLAQQLI